MSTTKPGFVYFQENPHTTPRRIKIGWTSRDPVQRLKELEHATGCELILLGFIWGTVTTGTSEWDLHKRFARYKIKRNKAERRSRNYLGEWFSVEIRPFVLEIINSGRRTAGDRVEEIHDQALD